ncbi:MAG: hypothetical protein LPK45_05145, partial [Bacteroidota bacterium]|nr:hypothetical protein [Bacteroidota bacterium]MDX5430446.1 hypothetical protein [Bacteroidota bacterium]MDX5469205.1 hypothetical protein [Bacteroidota bacterium]
RLQQIKFTEYQYRQLKEQIAFNPSYRVLRNFILGIVLSMVLFIGSAYTTLWYHFQYYSATTIGKVELRMTLQGGWQYRYTYEVDDKKYTKELPEQYIENLPRYGIVRVRYSTLNPVYARIMEE